MLRFALIEISDDEEPVDDLMEIFSKPRVVPFAQALNLRAVCSIDLETGFDLLTFEGRGRVRTLVRERRPRFVILSPPCTMFSAMQRMWNLPRMEPSVLRARMADAIALLDFAMEMAKAQVASACYFVLEHPLTASSWNHPTVREVAALPGVSEVVFHQCRFGLRSPHGSPMRKATKFLTNSPAVMDRFRGKFCTCEQPHKRIMGSEGGSHLAALAALYPPPLCRALAEAVRDETESARRSRCARARACAAGV